MIGSLSPLTRRTLALGLLIAVLLLGEALLVSPLLDWRARVTARIAATELLLLRTRAAAVAAHAAADAARDDAPVLGADAFLTAGENSLAAAQLQTLLRAAAAAEAVTLASMQVEPAAAEQGARRVTIRANLDTEFAPLLRLMHRLESGRPVLRLRGLEVQTVGGGEDPRLSATLEVTALMPPTAP